ncbi:hypothetical protein [Asticcacaulis sp. 201]|uniref:hypothetical protein n=1 Tax=Asticcacaulis sp. 201 TaxID=3028787 RepID=UPI002915F0A4|nr:hypothetical protein [Asticcacaulis sp. 201]MDV6333007.1 hypothetical protein [Asticcacaulis sp. 201]
MRSRLIAALALFLCFVSIIGRAGNQADRDNRAHCAAIGRELQRRAAQKATEVAELRAQLGDRAGKADLARLAQWDVYVARLDGLGRGLVANFTDPWPVSAIERRSAHLRETEDLTLDGEGCTGEGH